MDEEGGTGCNGDSPESGSGGGHRSKEDGAVAKGADNRTDLRAGVDIDQVPGVIDGGIEASVGGNRSG